VRRTAVGLIVALGTLALAGSAVANQWYIEVPGKAVKGARTRIPVGEVVEVPTEGTWLLRLDKAGRKHRLLKYECLVSGVDALSNTATEAHDEARALTFFSCPAAVKVSLASPYTGVLEGDGMPFREPLENVAVEVKTPHVSGLFTGSLNAFYGDYDSPYSEGKSDEMDNIFELRGQSGKLVDASGDTLQLAAIEWYGVKNVDRASGQLDGEPEEISGTSKEDAAKDEAEPGRAESLPGTS
jgi:hypothetical protein